MLLETPFFIAGLIIIILHEIDAVRCHEWRIFPGLSSLKDKTGKSIFLLAHIPIFYWIFWEIRPSHDDASFRTGFSIFLIIHVGLHLLFLRHPKNEFKDPVSWVLISGAGLCGLSDLFF